MRLAPAAAHARAAPKLAALSPERREIFGIRLDRWWNDLRDALTAVYPSRRADDLALRLIEVAAAAYAERDADLHRLDSTRLLEPDWFQAPGMLGYAAYADRFAGTLVGVAEHVDYLRDLGVTYLHLMPLLQPRPGDNDGGYAVADYRRVRSDLGTMEDLRALAATLRRHGISLVLDLVLNHVAREHEWAVRARAGEARYRDYFHWFADRDMPDAYERTLPEVFPDFAPGNFTLDDALRAWVWTTFNRWQWDVNWSNPDVFVEYAELVLFLANAGVEVIRLDAIAFVWKRLGTSSQNQPEVHAITQALRTVARIACPAVLFKAEAIVGPADLVQYLGQGRYHGKVSDVAYHNGLMVQIWSMLAAGNAVLGAHALRSLPPIPSTTAWITYLRCHDDIGWAIDDADARAVGLDGPAHRRFLSDYYSGQFPGSTAHGLVFQANPATGDRRISGTAASLAGLDPGGNDVDPAPTGIDAADRDAVADARARILLATTLILGWGGIPVLWSGDELGLLNDRHWADEPGHESDNRWAHRPRLPWPVARQAASDADTTSGSLYQAVRHAARVRAGLPHLHASVAADVLALSDPAVLPIVRRHPLGNLLGLYNVSGQWRPWPMELLAALGLTAPVDALAGGPPDVGADGNLWLAPYQAAWLLQGG